MIAAALVAAGPAWADVQLAVDKGCFNCHGTPPRKGAPTFAQLAAELAPLRDDPSALQRLCDRLRAGSIFGHVDAHERLAATDAARLVRWIADGAPRR